jgi:small subunit ribosomal protein S6
MFYEVVLVLRPDLSLKQIKGVVHSVEELIHNQSGSIRHSEYWGFRTLAYRVERRGKAHYVCLMIDLCQGHLSKLYHLLKFHKDVLRFLCLKKPDGFEVPTPLFQSELDALNMGEEEFKEDDFAGEIK